MNPLAPSDQAFLEEARGDLQMVKLASYVLMFLGGSYVFIGLAVGLIYMSIPLLADGLASEDAVFFGVFGLVMGVCCAGFGAPMIAGAVGLRQGRMWGWIIAVCTGALFATSLCMPFGVFLLYAMLNNEVRKAFLE